MIIYKDTKKTNTCKYCFEPIYAGQYCCESCWIDFEMERDEDEEDEDDL